MRSRRGNLVIVGIMFLVLSALGMIWVSNVQIQPDGASREAEIVDGAIELLLLLSVPVFAFVISVLAYVAIRFRAADDGDAEPVRTNRGFVWGWVAVTSSLAIYSIFNPGLTGLRELQAEPDAALNIEVTAEQWNWSFDYEELGVTLQQTNQLVLPVGTRVAFHITSVDVIHSFWIPVLRIKADAVPGSSATILTTPTRTGEFASDPNFRVQCAEICGTGHARMRVELTVLDESDFDAWVEENQGGQSG